jgi:hypothetical protein
MKKHVVQVSPTENVENVKKEHADVHLQQQ